MTPPRQALAAVMTAANGPLRLEHVPIPDLEPGAVLLQTLFSEVCGTDVHIHRGRLAGVPFPIIPGHVSVGRVVEVRGNVSTIDGKPLRAGSVVTFLDVHETCNHCWYCLVAKTSNRCPSRRVYGVTYSSNEGLLGGWAEFIYLKPGVKVVELPASLSPERLIAGGCALPTAIHAIDRAEIRVGDNVLIQGAGPVGLSATILALMSGAATVFVIDQHENRLAMAKAVGADFTLRLNDGAPGSHVERLLELTAGRGADVTVEATGAPLAVKEGIRMTRDGGRYILAGHYTDTGEIGLNPHLDINRKHLTIRGVWGVDFSHFYRMIGVLDRRPGRVAANWEGLISRRYALAEVDSALADVEAGRVIKAVIQPNPG
jgi:threonine dehydrogenase-like Zn-dependent dehydrogenase